MRRGIRMRRPRAALGVSAVLLAAAACERAPATIDDAILVAAGDAHSPTVAVAPDGTAYVAWVSGDEEFEVLLSRAGEEPVRVNDVPGDEIGRAHV